MHSPVLVGTNFVLRAAHTPHLTPTPTPTGLYPSTLLERHFVVRTVAAEPSAKLQGSAVVLAGGPYSSISGELTNITRSVAKLGEICM